MRCGNDDLCLRHTVEYILVLVLVLVPSHCGVYLGPGLGHQPHVLPRPGQPIRDQYGEILTNHSSPGELLQLLVAAQQEVHRVQRQQEGEPRPRQVPGHALHLQHTTVSVISSAAANDPSVFTIMERAPTRACS